MFTHARKLVASAALGGALLLTPASMASAQIQPQDGLVNVAIGDVTILEDVNVAVAAKVDATICGVDVGPVAVLGDAVDRSGETKTVCKTDQGDVDIEQNA